MWGREAGQLRSYVLWKISNDLFFTVNYFSGDL